MDYSILIAEIPYAANSSNKKIDESVPCNGHETAPGRGFLRAVMSPLRNVAALLSRGSGSGVVDLMAPLTYETDDSTEQCIVYDRLMIYSWYYLVLNICSYRGRLCITGKHAIYYCAIIDFLQE